MPTALIFVDLSYLAAQRFYEDHKEQLNFLGYLMFVLLLSLAVNGNAHGEEYQVRFLPFRIPACSSAWQSSNNSMVTAS